MLITVAHARSLYGNKGYCSRGMRAFAQRHRLDWERFLREGLPEEELLATGDDMARQVVEHAHRMEAK
jgi:hypothetical protein